MTLISINYKSISYFGGITLKSGRRGFAVYREGKGWSNTQRWGGRSKKATIPNPFTGGIYIGKGK